MAKGKVIVVGGGLAGLNGNNESSRRQVHQLNYFHCSS